MDAPVSPVRVLVGDSDDQLPDLWVDGRPSSRLVWWLCPVSGDSSSMPAQHGFWFDDQKRVASICPCHRGTEKTKDGAVGVGEVWSVDLTLKDEELVAEGEDFGVAGISCRENPSESVENKSNQSRK